MTGCISLVGVEGDQEPEVVTTDESDGRDDQDQTKVSEKGHWLYAGLDWAVPGVSG